MQISLNFQTSFCNVKIRGLQTTLVCGFLLNKNINLNKNQMKSNMENPVHSFTKTNLCVLSKCIVYWIHFQNIYTFAYQKTLLHTLLLLVFKTVENLLCILKALWNWGERNSCSWWTLPLVFGWNQRGYNYYICKCIKLAPIWGIGEFCKKKKHKNTIFFNKTVEFWIFTYYLKLAWGFPQKDCLKKQDCLRKHDFISNSSKTLCGLFFL